MDVKLFLLKMETLRVTHKIKRTQFVITYLVEMLQLQVESLTQQVSTMTQSYEQLIEELRERNSNGLIFLPFETLHQKILLEGTFGDGLYAQIMTIQVSHG